MRGFSIEGGEKAILATPLPNHHFVTPLCLCHPIQKESKGVRRTTGLSLTRGWLQGQIPKLCIRNFFGSPTTPAVGAGVIRTPLHATLYREMVRSGRWAKGGGHYKLYLEGCFNNDKTKKNITHLVSNWHCTKGIKKIARQQCSGWT